MIVILSTQGIWHDTKLIGWHIMNVNIMLDKAVGVPEHPDLLKTIEEELQAISDYNDKLEVLNKYF